MAKTSGEIEKEFIDGLKSITGKDLSQWLDTIKASGIEKRNDIIKWLKEYHGLGHMNANLLLGLYANDGKPVYANEADLLENQFSKYQYMKPLYEKLKNAILEWDKSPVFVVKKTYVSIAKKREFAAINIKKDELRLGLDLGALPFNEKVQKSRLIGPMTRISHMITIQSEEDINENLIKLLEKSNKRVNNK